MTCPDSGPGHRYSYCYFGVGERSRAGRYHTRSQLKDLNLVDSYQIQVEVSTPGSGKDPRPKD
jgi:hypothetical protein